MLEKTIAALRRDGGLYPLSAFVIVLAGLLIAGAYVRFIAPTPLTVAVAPAQGAEAGLIEAFARVLGNGSRSVRLQVRREASLEEAAQRLESRAVDLAIVRPDVSLPANGLTIAILRQEALFILHPAGAKIDKLSDFAGKRLALIDGDDADEHAMQTLLAFYDLSESVGLKRVSANEIEAAVTGGAFAGAAFFATPGDPEARRVAHALARAFAKPLSLLEIAQAGAFNASNPAFSVMKIPPGGLLANPAIPADETETTGVSWRLMARSGVDRGPISLLTERLFESRSALARASRTAITMKAPDTDEATSAVLPNHRGALDYFNREQLTFMDRYGDWLWFGLFAATGVSSAFAWIGRMFTRRRREIIDDALNRLCHLLSDARKADTAQKLNEISIEIDRLVAISVWRARRKATNPRVMSALAIAIDAARAAVRERRAELRRSGPQADVSFRLKSGEKDGPPGAR